MQLTAWLGAFALNVGYILLGSERPELGRRLKFIALMWPQNLISIFCRFAILHWGVTRTLLYWVLFLPLSVYETTTLQIMADLYERRPLKPPNWMQVCTQSKVAAIESIGYLIACRIWPWLPGSATSWPTAGTLVHSVWRAAVFDVGLDVGFYAFHRSCHVNRTLYRWVHAPHHTDTGKEHGHLVAYETYELSVIETLSILSSYLVGFELLGLFYPFTMFDVALYVSWAHLIELLGHTEMTWTPVGHWMRAIPDLLGLSLQVPHHTMHHQKPLSNFSKRLILFDLLFGTYEPPHSKSAGSKLAVELPHQLGTVELPSSDDAPTSPTDDFVIVSAGAVDTDSCSGQVARQPKEAHPASCDAGESSPLRPRNSLPRVTSA